MSITSLFSGGFTGLAHRGGSKENMENSLTAFRHASALGYRAIETDIQVSADGTIYIFHDDTLDRTTTGTGMFNATTDDELSRITLNNGEPIPRLEDALTACPDSLLNIDVKTDDGIAPMATFLNTFGHHDRICLASFSTRRLNRIRHLLTTPCAMSGGQMDVFKLFLGSFLKSFSGFSFGRPHVVAAQVPETAYGLRIVTPRFIRHCHKLGIAVHVWTIDDAADMTRLIRLGVDGIVTDCPTTLRKIAVDEGVWRQQ